jgi:prepilin-type processing-associated H-X9-DG protein
MNAKRKSLRAPRAASAFTLTELVVVVTVLALLALCLLPALARTQPETRAFQCLNNHRQLARAWRMYADDNSERLAGCLQGVSVGQNDPRAPWAQGWLDWSIANANTNSILVTDLQYASLPRYFGNDAQVLQCPADQFLSAAQRARGWKRRVRSVSANIYVGGVNAETGPTDASFVVVKKCTELTNPKPAETWLFIDEHPDSMNDPVFYAPRSTQWIDLPANLHDGGAGVAFADGSAEVHRWEGSLLNNPVRFVFTAPPTLSNDPDIAWLRYRTPRKPGAN